MLSIKIYHQLLLLLLLFSVSCKQPANEMRKPNIVLILGDDIGYSDISPFGSEIKPQIWIVCRMKDSGLPISITCQNVSPLVRHCLQDYIMVMKVQLIYHKF